MVQIMSDSGQSSRNRAERASLDGKPEYPTNASDDIPNNIVSKQIEAQSPPLPEKLTTTLLHENYEDLELEHNSIHYHSEDGNNNNSETEKDLENLIKDPWGATSSVFIFTPEFYDDVDTYSNATTVDNISESYAESKISNQIQRSNNISTRISNFKNKHTKRRRNNLGETLSITKSFKSTPTTSSASSITRRSSHLSSSSSSDMDSTNDEENFQTEVTDFNDVDVEIKTTPKIPYCYRCCLKFSTYNTWKKHAVFEHILKKNPIPMVEMNYVDPSTHEAVQIGTDLQEEEEGEVFSPSDAGSEGNREINEDFHLGNLKLRIGKEKGGYVVRSSSSLGGNEDDASTCPQLALQTEPLPHLSTQSHHDSICSMPMPTLTPCPDLQQSMFRSNTPIFLYPLLSTNANNVTVTPPPNTPIQTANLEEIYRRTVSIETELENDLNVGFEDFEMALEMATERSRVALPAEESNGGIAITLTQVSSPSPPSSQDKMISEDVPIPTLSSILDKDIPKESANKESVVKGSDTDAESLFNSIVSDTGREEQDTSEENNPEINDSEQNNNKETGDMQLAGSFSLETISFENNDLEKVSEVEKEEEAVEGETLKSLMTEQPNVESEKENNDELVENPINEINATFSTPENPPSVVREVGEIESDDFQCSACQKRFTSDDELMNHFSEEHVRVRNIDILEPESPFPPTPQRSIFSNDDEEENLAAVTRILEQHAQQVSSQQPSAYVEQSPSPVNLLRRVSNENGVIHHQPPQQLLPRNAQEELQNLMWRNQINTQDGFIRANSSQQGPFTITMHSTNSHGQLGSAPRPFNNQGQPQGQRISPPNSTGGMRMLHTRPEYPANQAIPHGSLLLQNPSRPQLVQYSLGGQGQPRQQIRGSPPFPMSLHSALTGGTPRPNYTQASIRPPPNMSMHIRAPTSAPSMRQINSSQHQIQGQYQAHQLSQQNGLRQMQPRRSSPPNNIQMSQTIGMQQQLLNQMNAQRELNSHFQQRHHIQPPTRPPMMQRTHSMPRMGSLRQPMPQQQQQQQPLKRVAQIGSIEISDIPLNKEPRLDIGQAHVQKNLPPAEIAEIRPSNNLPPQVPKNVSAAIGSVGSDGVQSVRLGNSITLSVCSSNSATGQNSPSISPVQQDSLSRHNSPTLPNNSNPVASVLAVRGVTVTRASPPVNSSSTNSNPNPSHSPLISQPQNHSVIQRGPRSMSPADIRRDRNFSPPVISSVRGSTPTQQHNFAIPRAPCPIQRLSQEGSPYAVNSSAERPDRPPTVDLTDDNIQAHAIQAQQKIGGLQQTIRRVMPPPAGSMRGTSRPFCCNICGVICGTLQALEMHKVTSHGAIRINPQSTSPNQIGHTTASVSPRFGGNLQQTSVRSPLLNRLIPGQGVNLNSPIRQPQASAPILRNTQLQPQFRSQTPSRPNLPNGETNNQEKYLYIPLLDLSRIDSNKMKKLEELGISCIVPLQGNNMIQMGIPIMNLRDHPNNQHVPWDSVLPMGPVHQPVIEQLNGNRGNNNSSNSGYGGSTMRFN